MSLYYVSFLVDLIYTIIHAKFCIIKLDRDLVEAVGNAYPYCDDGRNPQPEKVEKLLEAGAQPDFVMPWLPTNKRRRLHNITYNWGQLKNPGISGALYTLRI